MALTQAHPGRIWINIDSLQTLGVVAAQSTPAGGSETESQPSLRIHPSACALPRGTQIFIRVNGPVGGGHHAHVITCGPASKFGIPWQQLPLALSAADAAGLCVVGLHQHIGSGIRDVATFGKAIDVLLGVARSALSTSSSSSDVSETSSLSVPHPLRHLRYLNFGGGIGVPYRPCEAHVDLTGLGAMLRGKCATFAAELTAARAVWQPLAGRSADSSGGAGAAAAPVAAAGVSPSAPLTVLLEPGRFPVAEAGYLVATATTIKPVPSGRVFLGIDTGFNHLVRPVMYGSYHHVSVIHKGGDTATAPSAAPRAATDSEEERKLVPYHIAGNVCESGDVFSRQDDAVEGTRHAPPPSMESAGDHDGDAEENAPGPRLLSPVSVGDLLVFHNAGAYGHVMSSEYNLRPRPAEVTIQSEDGVSSSSDGGGYAITLSRKGKSVEQLVQEALGE